MVLTDLTAYADDLLQTACTPDYPHALNGLQLENGSSIRAIAAAVDCSTRAIEGAIAAQANLLIVHHGMFWPGVEPITGTAYRRLRLLLGHDIAVYSSHLPLDRHPSLGNNVLLARELKLVPSSAFAKHESIHIGVAGESDVDTSVLVERAGKIATAYGGNVRTSVIPENHRTRRWAICTGAGASTETLREAAVAGIDTLIVGEGPHHTAVAAEELGLTIIYAGHYATETFGVRALAHHLSEKFQVPWSFVMAPTGL
jgi:dinuclear metal center YbgI/SA1388 family protein